MSVFFPGFSPLLLHKPATSATLSIRDLGGCDCTLPFGRAGPDFHHTDLPVTYNSVRIRSAGFVDGPLLLPPAWPASLPFSSFSPFLCLRLASQLGWEGKKHLGQGSSSGSLLDFRSLLHVAQYRPDELIRGSSRPVDASMAGAGRFARTKSIC